jgi:type VI secretion system protein ImpI
MATSNNSFVDQKKIAAMPIRIGRNALNNCQISHNFVSDHHARIDEAEGRLWVRDLGSKNGVYVRRDDATMPVRIAVQTPVDLGLYKNEFFVGPLLRIKVDVIEAEEEDDRGPASSGTVLGNRQMLMEGLPAKVGRELEVRGQIPPRDYGGPRPSPITGPNPIPSPGRLPDLPEVGALPPLGGAGPAPVPQPVPAFGSAGYSAPLPVPAAYAPPQQQEGPPAYGGYAPPAPPGGDLKRTGHFGMSNEILAFQGLRELASSLVPGRPLETTGDVARLVTKLHDAIEVFCRCFIPLRQGYAQFVSSMDLQRAAMQRSVNRSRAYVAVEMANTPAAVAMALLDWRDQSLDAPKAIEGIFADLMVHQVALLDGVMQGVRALLEELSPEAIEKIVDAREPPGLLGNLPGRRHKALWEAFCERYEQLSEEKQAFSHIFGPEFTDAYREYRQRKPDR